MSHHFLAYYGSGALQPGIDNELGKSDLLESNRHLWITEHTQVRRKYNQNLKPIFLLKISPVTLEK